MIAVYAQATERQGIDAAIDGSVIDANEAAFVDVRRMSRALNLKPEAGRAGGVGVHLGLGIVRLQIDASTLEDRSRVIVVLPSPLVNGGGHRLVESVVQTAEAIDRYLEPSDVEAALSLATHLIQVEKSQRLIAMGASLCLLAVGLAVVLSVRRRSP